MICVVSLYPSQRFAVFCCHKTEAYSEPSQLSEMKVSAKIVNGLKKLNISAKSSILDVWLGSESASVKVDAKHQFKLFLIAQRPPEQS